VAKQPRSSKPGPVAKRTPRTSAQPRASVARKRAAVATAPDATEPAVLTANQAFDAAAAATGETVMPKPKRAYNRKVVPVAVKAAPEPTLAAPTEIPAVAAPLQEEKRPEPVEEPALVQAEGNAIMTDVIETTKKFTDEAKARLCELLTP